MYMTFNVSSHGEHSSRGFLLKRSCEFIKDQINRRRWTCPLTPVCNPLVLHCNPLIRFSPLSYMEQSLPQGAPRKELNDREIVSTTDKAQPPWPPSRSRLVCTADCWRERANEIFACVGLADEVSFYQTSIGNMPRLGSLGEIRIILLKRNTVVFWRIMEKCYNWKKNE